MNRRDTRAFGTNGLPDPHLNVGGGVMIDGVLYSRERYEAMLRGQATPGPMPETPDFHQIAQQLIYNLPDAFLYRGAGAGAAVPGVVEQLRQVWNARGAADLERLEPIIEKLGDTMDPDNARVFAADAIRESDR